MADTSLQKFVRHCKASGIFYAVNRSIKYIAWRNRCKKMGIDWRKFSRER